MRIAEEFQSLVSRVSRQFPIPPIKDIVMPPLPSNNVEEKASNFGAVRLKGDHIGIVYLNLEKKVKHVLIEGDYSDYKGKKAEEVAQLFLSRDLEKKTIGLGAINAISNFVFNKVQYKFNYTTNSMGLLDLKTGDTVGMVGFFYPLIKRIERMEIDVNLRIIEKKENLVQRNKNWVVSLDPSILEQCNKILCTSTTVLNESIDKILDHTKKSEKMSVIGPTAGFLPDPLFSRNITVVGGSHVIKPKKFIELLKQNQKWSDTAKKFCIQRENYKGVENLIDKLHQ